MIFAGVRVQARPAARLPLSTLQAALAGCVGRVVTVDPAAGVCGVEWSDAVGRLTGSRLHPYPLAWLVNL